MKKHLTLSAFALAALLPAALSAQSLVFDTGTLAYDSADTLFTPSASAMAENTTNIYLRDPRAVMQTFQVAEPFELAALSTIIRRAVEGAQFTLTLRDFGPTAPGGSVAPGTVAGAAALSTISYTVGAAVAFGEPGPVTAADPATTLTWNLASPVPLVPGRVYAFVFDGTGTVNAEHTIAQYSRTNPYAGGRGYYQNGNDSNFLSGGNIFGEDYNDQVDFALALTAVPEPSTYAALAGLAALALGIVRRRRLASR